MEGWAAIPSAPLDRFSPHNRTNICLHMTKTYPNDIMSPHDRIFSTGAACGACDKYEVCLRHASDEALDMPQMMPQLMPQTYLSVLYLISSKRLLFKNIAHYGSFQHCTWLCLGLP